ncbi:MAG: hypothetical protein KF858_16505 [Candidatus Sumerlaeia bacterium]|nr:hypothetical protein [Candidatus Sumerlaeia bacterium]
MTEPTFPVSNLRLVAVFVMGISVGICLTLIYVTMRDPRPPIVQVEGPTFLREVEE